MIRKLPFDKKEGAFIKFLELLENNHNILDIGANIGVMTYHFVKKLPSATIHSFEPVLINYKNLERIVRKYKLSNVNLYNYALGNKNGDEQILLPKTKGVTFHGLSHIVKDTNHENGIIYTVPIKKLDDVNGFLNMPISAIKIDVENYEHEVLLGAEKIIEKNRPIIYCELWEGENKKNCFELMSKKNYSIFIEQFGSLVLFNEENSNQNFFFIPVERIEKLKLNIT